ncbi:glycosyltransferase family 4 protein [Nonomuraea sediminis]|uniref:glycosyltransferase family 4 protein n=1 Tax=Nonomuraea sediminis TaxID=2835864 RepID=UPI001BDCEC8D|nr:glycosyltransferase family 4 protein [Nonomuraea sediminis]
MLLWLLNLANRRRARRAPPPDAGTVRFILFHANGMGGTIRSVYNLAGYLAMTRQVEIVSVVRTRAEPFFPLPPGVRITYLEDRLDPPGGLYRLLSRRRSVLVPGSEHVHRLSSLWTDLVLLRYLRSLRGGVLVTTRPSLNLMAAFAPPGVVTIGQEHRHFASYAAPLRKVIKRRYGRLSAVVVLTRDDEDRFARAVPGATVFRIPNALTPLGGGLASPDSKVAVALGRLDKIKGYDLLLRAWQLVRQRHPDWTLRVFGSGPQLGRLRRQVTELGLEDGAFLMGRTGRVGEELAEAGMFVLSSRSEALPMVIIEAMSKGLPVVSFACPSGPQEMITDGVDGVLVPPRDVEALAEAVCALIGNRDLRVKLGAAALRTATRYDLRVVGGQWDDLLARITSAHDARPGR